MDRSVTLCQIWRVLLVYLGAITIGLNAQQQGPGNCKPVMQHAKICIDGEDSTGYIQCPQGTQVNIHKAVVHKSSRPQDSGTCGFGIPEKDEQCVMEDVTKDVQKQCADLTPDCPPDIMSSCSYTKSQSELGMGACTGHYSSKPYVLVGYTCNPPFDPKSTKPSPGHAFAMSMEKERSYKGKKVHIDSHTQWVKGVDQMGKPQLNLIKKLYTGCCVSIPTNTEMMTYPFVFLKMPKPQKQCDQRITVTDPKSGEIVTHCGNSTYPKMYDCKPQPTKLFVEYFSTDPYVGSAFVFVAQVAGDFHVSCGVRKKDCKPDGVSSTTKTTSPYSSTPTGSTKTTTSTSPSPPIGTGPPAVNWMALLIGLALGLLVLLILIIACILCFRKSPKIIVEPTETTESALTTRYFPANDGGTEMYVQVLEKQQDQVNPFYDANTLSTKEAPVLLLGDDPGEYNLQYMNTLPAGKQQDNIVYTYM